MSKKIYNLIVCRCGSAQFYDHPIRNKVSCCRLCNNQIKESNFARREINDSKK